MSRNLVRNCCTGIHCHGDDPSSKVFYNCLIGQPLENGVVIWLKLGRDEEYVKNPEPPSSDSSLCRVLVE
jgi:hypothetical protein